ncbi:uncharacterized protein [Solanum lycopersicum]|uniref:uncharacterized protein n=1 Tax=Solanum lycopersicum TaxID=4081 RepID=UPI0002BCAA68
MIFPELKDRLTLDSVLTLQKSGEGYVVYCDSYAVGLGCILTSDGKVIAYAYGLLKIHEKNYHSHDPEFENVRELNLHQRRWLEQLQDNNMSVHYNPVKANVMIDALRRLSMGSVSHIDDEKKNLVKEVPIG